ncbi:MAG: ABC transporter permease subunit [Planctomycetes bacterium]|nr:ABC transporter permease subunit [Planctomycetota bacterium]
MGRMWALVRRELAVYFVSPMAYVILTGMLFVLGGMFYSNVQLYNSNRVPFTFTPTLTLLVWIIVFICPWVTARLIAEEKNRGTIETLMTAPVRDVEVVLSKYVAAMGFIAYLLVPTLFLVLLMTNYADVDWGAVLTGYAGVLCAAAWIVAIGTFVSSLCNSQVTAGILTLLVAFGLMLVNVIPQFLPEGNWLRATLLAINLVDYMGDFLKGVVDTRQVALAASMVVFFLFQTVIVVGSRRWR